MPGAYKRLTGSGVQATGSEALAARTGARRVHRTRRGRSRARRGERARTEYRITAFIDGVLRQMVIDRLFEEESGQRWIVDYKTSTHEGGDLEEFLDCEQERYRAQLGRYAKLMQMLDNRPVKLGLYFPLLKGWREWTA
jgi:ATP-dependent helicase/nuclease subunit A